MFAKLASEIRESLAENQGLAAGKRLSDTAAQHTTAANKFTWNNDDENDIQRRSAGSHKRINLIGKSMHDTAAYYHRNAADHWNHVASTNKGNETGTSAAEKAKIHLNQAKTHDKFSNAHHQQAFTKDSKGQIWRSAFGRPDINAIGYG